MFNGPDPYRHRLFCAMTHAIASNLWAGVLFLVFVNIVVGAVMLVGTDKIRRRVRRNLDSAADGGQFEPDGSLCGMTPDEIAYDLTVYAADLEDYRPEELAPYVREWLRQTKRPTNERPAVCQA